MSKGGLSAPATPVTLAADANQTMNLKVAAVGLSLGDLGFTPEQSKGSALD